MTQQSKVLSSFRRSVFCLLLILSLVAVLAACSPAAQPAATPAQAPGQTATATFAKDVQPILAKSCVGCHGASGGLSLQTYDSLMKGGKSGAVIVPGDAAGSLLVKYISSGRMPQGGSKLAQSAIDAISAWVAAGAKNN